MDSYCRKCLLQFDNKIAYNMHLSIVHKENVEIEEPEKLSLQCENCDKAFSTRSNLNKHVSSIQAVLKEAV